MPLELALLPGGRERLRTLCAIRGPRANGLWQFMPGTGERFGLKQDWWYDGRRDVDGVDARRARLPAVHAR